VVIGRDCPDPAPVDLKGWVTPVDPWITVLDVLA